MKRIPVISRLLCVALLLAATRAAGEVAWDERLARAVSERLRAMDQELAELTPRLEQLPKVPINDQGGTGGYASLQLSATPAKNSQCAVEVRWPSPALVDLVALVPARRYDAAGLDAQYGLPDDFTVDLIDAEGKVVGRVAREQGARNHPVRRGHPFLYAVSPPVEARGLRISASRLHDSASDEGFVHAWAEVFVFEGERNLALGGEVRSQGGQALPAPWHWNPAFLVDGQTPLGLPEIPAEEHGDIGWLSEGRTKASEAASMTVDLGEVADVDAVRLLPSKRPTSDLPSGFGFPRKLTISISANNDAADRSTWSVVAERGMRNPGHNPVAIPFPATRGRYVRIEATELWKAFDDYPAFFALSEVEILAGNHNLAQGKPVYSPDGMSNMIATSGRVWSSAALSDGFGPDGRLVSTRDWLTALNQRLQIESRCHELRVATGQLINGWRRAGLGGLAMLGVAGAFLIIVLPIRYRRHAQRELIKVRERIAGDLHDEVGSNLGSIQMFADLAASRSGRSEELKRIQRIAGETVSAVRDIVWLLRPEGEHRIGTVEHLRETSSIMLESLDWKFTANEDAWLVELPDEATRHLFLFFRESLHNIIRHARAAKVEIRVEMTAGKFRLAIADDGIGIEPERLARPATLHALRQRAEALGAEFEVSSEPGAGTRLTLAVPVPRGSLRKPRAAAAGEPHASA
jgi:signal transduction histidine kinase